jgi:hypothetical protein
MPYNHAKSDYICLAILKPASFFCHSWSILLFCVMSREQRKRDSEKQEIALKKLYFIKII